MSEHSGRRLQGRPSQARQEAPGSQRQTEHARQRERADLQHQAEHTHQRRPALAGYLVILFAAAFLLLLMAYFQQQRQSSQAADDALKQSTSAVQSIQTLMDESKALREENEALKEQVEKLEQSLDAAETFGAEAQNDGDGARRAVKAMGYFWQINEAYVRQRYTLCRELIQQFEAEQYNGPSALPDEDYPADNGRFSPAERYKEIYDALY